MPLWKIAWRSIQRRALASLLTTLSMALGVMLVVAVLLILGVVDDSFKTNSSLGYDTIVGAKGGELQLTLNTVYYLSQPVENLPYEFYRQFLPASLRTDRQAMAGRDYENRIEVFRNGDWHREDNEITIPAGELRAEFRVPLIPHPADGPRDFTVTLEVTSKNVVNRVSRLGVEIQPGKGLKDTAFEVENAEEETTEETHTEPETSVEDAPLFDLPPALELEYRPSFSQDEFAYFQVSLDEASQTPVVSQIQLSDGADGNYRKYLADSDTAVVPVCLGDYFQNYRVVGTVAEFFDIVYDKPNKRGYEFASGGNFTGKTEGFGVFEAIIGAKVARDIGIRVGDTIQPSHAAPDGDAHQEFMVVGILKSSGTPQDRAVFVNMEGFNLIPDHIRDDGLKEITALLVDTADAHNSDKLKYELVDGPIGQAVKPIRIVFELMNNLVGPVKYLLLAITAMICVVSGISILVSIYNSMNDRKQEIAVMRSLGAGRGTVMTVVLLESVMISLAGGMLGWVSGHALIGLASYQIEDKTGVVISAFQLAPPVDGLSSLLGPGFALNISVEVLLIPSLVLLAIIVGFMPALSAYRTDVAKALQSSP